MKRLRTCRKTDYRMKRLWTCRKTDYGMKRLWTCRKTDYRMKRLWTCRKTDCGMKRLWTCRKTDYRMKRLWTCRKTDYRMKRLWTCRKTDCGMNESEYQASTVKCYAATWRSCVVFSVRTESLSSPPLGPDRLQYPRSVLCYGSRGLDPWGVKLSECECAQ
jgi:hypothetical protein